MSTPSRRPLRALPALAAATVAASAALAMTATIAGDEAAFMAENNAAMARMMKGMDVHPSSNIDRDFATMMIPHHQGAIDMAQAELRHGDNERLRRLAQGMIVEQQQEIVAMRAVLDRELADARGPARQTRPPSRPSGHAHHAAHTPNP